MKVAKKTGEHVFLFLRLIHYTRLAGVLVRGNDGGRGFFHLFHPLQEFIQSLLEGIVFFLGGLLNSFECF